MNEPYREPELPAAEQAQRRLDARLAEARRAGQAERETAVRRRLLVRRLARGGTACVFLLLPVLILMRVGLGFDHPLLHIGLILSGLGIPVGLVISFGMTIEPWPADAAPPVSRTRVG
ncbi:MAG: hypothetical protein AB8I08_13175 [Sandaracinaceae bacterium]